MLSTRAEIRLPDDEAHLWVVDLAPQALESERRRAATTPGERDRAARFRLPADRERYLMAHGALRLVLAGCLACEPADLRISTDERGKPFLQDTDPGEGLQFNLSHSGALALIVVGRGRRLGVDVEQLREMPDLDGIADRICTPEERASLAALAPARRLSAFFRLWTRKEALAKATGEGIGAVSRNTHVGLQDRWTLVDVTDLPGYAACVAAEGTGWRLVRRTFTY